MGRDNSHSRTEGEPKSSDRTFGLIFTAFFSIIASLPLFRGDGTFHTWALTLAGSFFLVSLVAPSTLAPLHRLWIKFGNILHSVTSPIILGLIFYGVITPTGIILRLGKANLMGLKPNSIGQTYWISRKRSDTHEDSMNHQF